MKETIQKLDDKEYFSHINEINRKIVVDVRTISSLEQRLNSKDDNDMDLDKVVLDCEKSLIQNIQILLVYINCCPLQYENIIHYHSHYMETVKKLYSVINDFIKASKSMILNSLDYLESTNYKKYKAPSIQLIKDTVKVYNNFKKVYYNPELQSEEDFETYEVLVDSEQQSQQEQQSEEENKQQQQMDTSPILQSNNNASPNIIISNLSSPLLTSNTTTTTTTNKNPTERILTPPVSSPLLIPNSNNNNNNNINNGSGTSSPFAVPFKVIQDSLLSSSPSMSPLKLSDGMSNNSNIDKSAQILLEYVIKIKQAALESDSDQILSSAKVISNEVVNIAKDLKFKTLSKNLKESAANLIHAARFVSKSKNDQYYIDQLELAGEKVNEVIRRTLYAVKSVSRTTINMNLRQSMLNTSSNNLTAFILSKSPNHQISSSNNNNLPEISPSTTKVNNNVSENQISNNNNNDDTINVNDVKITTITSTSPLSSSIDKQQQQQQQQPTINIVSSSPVISPVVTSPPITSTQVSSTTPTHLQPQQLPLLHPVHSPPPKNYSTVQAHHIKQAQQQDDKNNGVISKDEKQKTFGKFISKLVSSNKGVSKNKRGAIPFDQNITSPPITSQKDLGQGQQQQQQKETSSLSRSLNSTPISPTAESISLTSSLIASSTTSTSTSTSQTPNSITPEQLSNNNSPILNNKQPHNTNNNNTNNNNANNNHSIPMPIKNKERSFTIGMVSGKHSHILMESPRSKRAIANESAKQILSVISQKFPNFEKELRNHGTDDLSKLQEQIIGILKTYSDELAGGSSSPSQNGGISPKLMGLSGDESPSKDYQRISLRYKMTRKLGTIKKRPINPFQNNSLSSSGSNNNADVTNYDNSTESDAANDYFINTASSFVEESIDFVNRCHEFSILTDLSHEAKPHYHSTIDYLINILLHAVKLSKVDNDSYIYQTYCSSRDYIQNMKQRGGKCDSNLVTAATKLYKHVIIGNLDKSIHTLCHSVRVLAIQMTIIVISIASKPWDYSGQLQLFSSAKCFSDVLISLLDALENKYYITTHSLNSNGTLRSASGMEVALSRVVEDEDTDDDDVNIWLESNNENNVKYDWISDEGSKTGRHVIKAGTLNKLVEGLTMEKQYDVSRFTKTFLLTYQSFVNPWRLFEKLKQRYHVPTDKSDLKAKIQLRVVSFIQTWVEKNFDDFDESLIKELKKFCDQLGMDENNDLAYILRDKIQKKEYERHTLGERNSNAPSMTFPELMIPEGQKSPSALFLLLNESEIARQLTLIDFNIFSKIEPTELLDQNWNKDSLKYKSPNVIEMINRANRFSYWVSSQILWQEDIHERVKIIEKFITVAKYLREMNNFNTLLAIFAGLNTAPILRLKKTFNLLSPAITQVYNGLEKLMSSTSSYKNYRQATKTISPPYLPYLPVILSDLTMTEEGNPDKLGNLINFQKRELICRVISEVQATQLVKFEFPIVEPIHTLLSELPSSSPNELYALSLLREPRGDNSVTISAGSGIGTLTSSMLGQSYNIETTKKIKF